MRTRELHTQWKFENVFKNFIFKTSIKLGPFSSVSNDRVWTEKIGSVKLIKNIYVFPWHLQRGYKIKMFQEMYFYNAEHIFFTNLVMANVSIVLLAIWTFVSDFIYIFYPKIPMYVKPTWENANVEAFLHKCKFFCCFENGPQTGGLVILNL